MPRAIRLLAAAERSAVEFVDTLILTSAQRQTANAAVFGVKGTCVEIDLPEPVRLRTDDVLELDDGRFVEVVAEPEPLIEVRASDPGALARIAWHLGDRHIAVELSANRVRVRRDSGVEKLLRSLGTRFIEIEAPFEPEGGAYAVPGHHHEAHHDDHHDAHQHDHSHAHPHDHGHDHDYHHKRR
jgi:urease accessory protein